jgi:hypothetical protein
MTMLLWPRDASKAQSLQPRVLKAPEDIPAPLVITNEDKFLGRCFLGGIAPF